MQKATIGGILSIVAGALGLLGGLVFLVVALFAGSIFSDPSLYSPGTINGPELGTFMAVVYVTMGLFALVLGAFGVAGGIFAIQRKHWGWALAGSIAGCLTFMPVGIAAVVLTALGKPEFDAQAAPVPPPQPQMNNPA